MIDFEAAKEAVAEVRLPGWEWEALRQKVYLRDGKCCLSCLKPVKKFVCDHIVPKALGGSDDESNLQTLCVCCDKKKTGHDKRLIRNARKAKRKGW